MSKKPVVFLVCTGVGHIRRGYESFTEECFAALKDAPGFKLYLLKGGGQREEQVFRVPCIQRCSAFGKKLSAWLGIEAYLIEQFSFLFSMLPLLICYQPRVIYYSDFKLGTWLWQLRRLLKFRYKLLFANGAPNGPPFTRMDHVQQLLPYYYQQAIQGGATKATMTLLPYGFNIPNPKLHPIPDKRWMRANLQLPSGKKIILSIGAINRHHKRMDYIIKEFATLNLNNYYLVLLGQFENESASIVEEADKYIGTNSYRIIEVKPAGVNQYLAAADYFILGSLSEGFGRVLVEAIATGLLPIVHDYPVVREVLQQYGIYINLTIPGGLQKGIATIDSLAITTETVRLFAYDHYAWDNLQRLYEAMIQQLIV